MCSLFLVNLMIFPLGLWIANFAGLNLFGSEPPELPDPPLEVEGLE